MTADVRESERRLSPERSGTRTGSDAVWSAVASIPERLLLAFLVFCYVSAVAYVGGFFRPVVVAPVTLVLVALTWWFLPAGGGRTVWSAVGSLLALGVSGAWFLLNLPYLGERIRVGRDPDVYTLAALWLLNNRSPEIPVPPGSTEASGFYLVDGVLEPQGNHLVAAVSASAGWVFGENAVFWGNLACGAAALLALYVLGRRLVGPLWALVPVLALAVSLPMLEFSRAMYSEPLALTFTFLGASLLWDAWKSDRLPAYVAAGVAFGGVALARIDGTLPLIGVVGGLAVAAVVHPGPPGGIRRWAAASVLLGSLPGLLLGFADLYFYSGRYIADLRSQFSMLGAAVLVATVLAAAAVVVPARRHPAIPRVVSRAALAGAALGAVAFAVLATRPWWHVARGPVDVPLIAGLQALNDSPVDGTRTYAEDSFQWLSWYHGWPVVVAGLIGLLAWLALGTRSDSARLLWLSALLLPSAALYLTQPSIAPDQIWAMRRFLPVVVPGLLLATAWVARQLSLRLRPLGAILAAALVVSAIVLPVQTASALWSEKNYAGALSALRTVCGAIDGRPTIVTEQDTLLPTVIVLCDVPTYSVAKPRRAALADAREALGGGPAVLVTQAPDAIPWEGEAPTPTIGYVQTIWERTLEEAPDKVLEHPVELTLGLVEADGTVVPLTSGGD